MSWRLARSVIATAAILTVLLTLPAATQKHSPDWTHPRTSWGAPDLQGVWSNETITPFERPPDQADKEFLSAEEVTAAEQRIAAVLERGDQSGPPKTEPPLYAAPWTVEVPLVARPNAKLYEYACHEGNQAVRNILRGARVQAQGAAAESN